MKRNLFVNLLLFLFMIIIFPKNAHAVTFSVLKSQDNIKPGSQVTVTINASVENNASLQGFELLFRYDADSLEYTGSQVSDGVSANLVSNGIDFAASGVNFNSDFVLATINFNVKSSAKTGNKTLSLTKKSCQKNEEVSCNANGSNIAISAPSSDATLKSLKIPNLTLSPEFNKNTYNYKASVKDMTQLTINAQATEDTAKIQITENYKNLQKGSNKIKIVVTAESGASKTYTIDVDLTLTPTNEELLKSNALLNNITIKGQKIDFKQDEKKYYLKVPYKVTELKINAKPVNEKSKVEIDNTKLKVGKNNITITVKSEDETNTETYQIIVTRQKEKKQIVQTCPNETVTSEWVIFYVTAFVMFTLGNVLGFFLCKKDVLKKIFKKKPKKKEEPVDAEELSDTIEIDTDKINKKMEEKEISEEERIRKENNIEEEVLILPKEEEKEEKIENIDD